MDELVLTEEERKLIITRRRLSIERIKRAGQAPKNPAKVVEKSPKQANGWDAHESPCKVHQGRLTESHPLFWFEQEVFRKIGNMQHKEQHDKIAKLLKVPVQNVFRDRVYHSLCHLDCLWEQKMLPMKYKHRYEKYKLENGIGDDNVHSEHKKAKPDYDYPVPVKNREFSFDLYPEFDEKEEFKAGKLYEYKAA